MKVVLPIDGGCFRVTPCSFCEIDSYLITPEIDAKWDANNLFYRSLITDKEGNVLSSGWPKFFNVGEKPDLYPDPNTFKDWSIQDKLDGSLLIADFVNGKFNMRTRGTASYIKQENSKDFELLPEKYPKVVEFLKENNHLSLLFEIVTPNNVIVIRPKDIEFYLLGAVNKDTLQVLPSYDLVDVWRKTGCVSMPQTYRMDNIHDVTGISQFVKNWKGKEGIVLCYNNNQNRVKIKSDWYCFIHRVKSQLNSEENLIEYFIESGTPPYDEFYTKIETEFDFEIAKQLQEQIARITNAWEDVLKALDSIKDFIHSIRGFKTRKEQAECIITTYKNCNKAPLAFSVLDNKEITKVQYIKLLKQFL